MMLSPFLLALPQLTSCSLVPSLARADLLSTRVSTTYKCKHCCPWTREGSPLMGTAGSGWRSFSLCGTTEGLLCCQKCILGVLPTGGTSLHLLPVAFYNIPSTSSSVSEGLEDRGVYDVFTNSTSTMVQT